ncbi:Tetratricopeptide TPR_2 repeat protein [Catenulispora acidiphila DSM 44928]|uniref:Tetratricopeptide TPR_2 repeat protein n=1 Tax=Catenulispora acidiphila (strain DSM 44928 / JCM 14897 / NBRC 102108 / NRRL B-24433 / ID139908) TaxID=479433 RepID=C7QG17_CATAD|nr:tetratricopeptide repeat protein [Catenulispora acidiphila]ACU70994.1 Tetratricopeptide TPR_2 repeat protein [Catenulispora acidiphila DSM 44928]
MADEESLRTAVERAAALIQLDRHAEAEPMLRTVLAADPEHFGALANLAWLLDLADRRPEALETARLLIAHWPQDTEGFYRAALIHKQEQDYDEALELLTRALEIAPDEGRVLRLYAQVVGRFPDRRAEALAAADRAIEVDPQVGESFQTRAMVLVDDYRWREAEVAMEQALQLEPTDTGLLIQAGIVKLRLGAIERAREAFTSALRLKPRPYRVREVLDTLETQGLPAPLLDVYTLGCQALDIPDLGTPGTAGTDAQLLRDQARVAASMWRAAVYNHAWSKDSRDRCRELVAAMLEADPTLVPARILAAEIASDDDRYEDLLALAMPLIAEGEATRALFRWTVYALEELERLDEALELATEGRRRFPDSSEAVSLQGRILAEMDRHDEAVAAAKDAVELAGDDLGALTSAANIYKRLDMNDEAKEAYKAILRVSPTQSTTLFQLGSLYMLAYQDHRAAERLIQRIELPDVGGDRTAVLAQIRFQLGKWDQALADFETALATPMRAPITVPGIIIGLQLFGPPKRFQPLLDKCVEIHAAEPAEPVTTEKLSLAAFTLIKYGALPEAAEVLHQILEMDPENYEATIMAQVVADPDEPEHAEALAMVYVEDAHDEEL